MKIVEFIPKGRENAVEMEGLALTLNKSKRVVRAMVLAARKSGEPICSTCEGRGGYYMPIDADEARIYLRQQTARIKSARAALRGVRKFIQDKERS